jgi:ribosome maturation factor RimP
VDRTKLDDILRLVSGQLRPAGFECVEVEWSAHDRILRVFVDHAEAPRAVIDLDGCVKVSKLLADLPELDAAVPGGYTLEVSSPGVERPLRRRRDFEAHLGQTVQVRLTAKVQDRRNGTGKLVDVASPQAAPAADDFDALITLQTEQGNWSFPLATLQRASLVYDWSTSS